MSKRRQYPNISVILESQFLFKKNKKLVELTVKISHDKVTVANISLFFIQFKGV